jgi:hypothetical protein
MVYAGAAPIWSGRSCGPFSSSMCADSDLAYLRRCWRHSPCADPRLRRRLRSFLVPCFVQRSRV